MNFAKQLINFLGLQRSMVGLLSMVILLSMGERMTERFLPIYILATGGGTLAIGILQGLTNFFAAFYSLPAGYLSDKIGAKRALLTFNLIAVSGYLLAILVPHWIAAVVAATLFLSWSSISLPACMKLVAETMPQTRRTMGVSMISLIRRIPMALGPLLGGLLIVSCGETDGVRIGFAIAALMAIAAIFIQEALIRDEKKSGEGPFLKNPLALFAEMNRPLRNLLLSDILVRFCEQIPYAFVVVWCLKVISSPVTPLQFGVLTTVEMVTSALVYIPVAWFADRSGKEPFVGLTFIFFSAFPLALLFCHSFEPLIAAFVLRGLKEFGEPTRKALIVDLCPLEKRASMFGLYYFIRDTIVSLAAVGGAFLWSVSPTLNLLSAVACGLAGTFYFFSSTRAGRAI